MALRRISTRNFRRGFTLMEMLVVIGLVAIIAGFSVVVGLDGFRGDSYRAERDSIVILLQQARTESLNNIDEEPHGVAFFPAAHPKSYVEFEGTSYTAPTHDPNKDTIVDAQYPVSFGAGAPAEITFEQLSGDANSPGTFALLDTERQFSSNLTITSEGGISW
jgi:prepilin-type N-terminal cleavage/methylation domain-containing protein